MAERLNQAVATLNDLIALARSAGLNDSAQFLAMAKLNLLMDINGVTEEEFRALCIALEGEPSEAGERRTRARTPAARRLRIEAAEGEGPLLRGAWRGPDGLASLRAGRGRTRQ